jgi:hypothetical protein
VNTRLGEEHLHDGRDGYDDVVLAVDGEPLRELVFGESLRHRLVHLRKRNRRAQPAPGPLSAHRHMHCAALHVAWNQQIDGSVRGSDEATAIAVPHVAQIAVQEQARAFHLSRITKSRVSGVRNGEREGAPRLQAPPPKSGLHPVGA